MFTHETWQRLDETIYQIYQAADLVVLRTVYLKNIAETVPYQAAFFDLKGSYRGKQFYYDPVAINLPAKALDAYYQKYADKDYTSWALNQFDTCFTYRDSDLISEPVKERSSFYREWLEPLGLSHGCGAIIAYDGIVYGTVTFARKKGDSDFSDSEIAMLDTTVRHLCLRFHQLYPSGITYGEKGTDIDSFQQRYHLTEREIRLCGLLFNNHSTKEIARMLCISVNTVNRHIANIYQKVGINSRMELMRKMMAFRR